MRRQNLFEIIFGVLCFLGFMLVFGTVGAMEHETITFERGILQSSIGIVVIAGAGYLGGFMNGKS
jgi:hypothetical protein